MALSAFTISEIEASGSDTLNGGLFDPSKVSAGGFTDGAATVANTSAPIFTSASYSFVAGDVGAWVYISSGSGWFPGWFKISSVTTGTATLDATIGHGVQATGGAGSILIGPTTVAGVSSGSGPTFGTWSIDYSQQTTAAFTYTDLASVGAGLAVSSVAFPFGKQQVGNGLVITGGTNFTAGYYVIASVAAAVATVVGPGNITTGAGVTGTGGQGGALASMGQAGSILNAIAGTDYYIQSNGVTPYTLSSASNNVAGGCLTLTAAAAATNVSKVIGYGTVRGDFGTKPILKANGTITAFTVIVTNTSNVIANIAFDGNSRATSNGINMNAAQSQVINCTFANFTVHAVLQASAAAADYLLLCYATTCAQGFSGCNCYYCVAVANTGTGFTGGPSAMLCVGCVSANNSGATTDGFATPIAWKLIDCTAYGNGRHGFNMTAVTAAMLVTNCYAENNAGFGFAASTVVDNLYLFNCGGFNNTSGTPSGIDTAHITNLPLLYQTLTSTAFTNAAGLDFSLNSTAGGGAQLRAAGIPGSAGIIKLPGLSTSAYIDIGAIQHPDPGGGGSTTSPLISRIIQGRGVV